MSSPVGIWHLNVSGYRLTLNVGAGLSTSLTQEGATKPDAVDNVSFADGILRFRRVLVGAWQWYRGRIEAGVIAGRFSHSTSSGIAPPDDSELYNGHFTGWEAGGFDLPRVYDLVIANYYRARLRLDSGPSGFVARMKIYATVSGGASGEGLEEDMESVEWNGSVLRFNRPLSNGQIQVYTATASGRSLSGTFAVGGGTASPFTGTRAEVLTYGLSQKTVTGRERWQEVTRRRLALLIQAADPGPASVEIITDEAAPLPPEGQHAATRDDDPANYLRNYTLRRVTLRCTLSNPSGGPPVSRDLHLRLAVPNDLTKPAPAVVAINGHAGSAALTFDPASPYWYGDAFARRGYVVVAVDIGHRPLSDRGAKPLYADEADCSMPNGLVDCKHDAVRYGQQDSDWEEDGERAWDASRAVDYLLSLPQVDPQRIAVVGHSLGGEVATMAAALDPRISTAVASGWFPDFALLKQRPGHGCWQWNYSDLTEYIDLPDLHALCAPRRFFLQVGKRDDLSSVTLQPYACSKQAARRARTAYGPSAHQFIHHLHPDLHNFHAGDICPRNLNSERYVRTPAQTEPTSPRSLTWQTDGVTVSTGKTLFELLEG